MKKQIIDFVITWVDGSDPLWFRQKQNAKKKQGVSVDIDDRIERYRDWEILKYLFRSIENFAPWVNNVYSINEQIQNIAQKKDTLCRRMYN